MCGDVLKGKGFEHVFCPTLQFRFQNRAVERFPGSREGTFEQILQQKYINGNNEHEWRDIPVVEEE